MQSNEVTRFRAYIHKQHQHMIEHWDDFIIIVSAVGFIGYCIGGLIILFGTSISNLFIIPWNYSLIVCLVGHRFLRCEYAAENGYTFDYDGFLVPINKPDEKQLECEMSLQTDDDGVIHVLT